MIHSRDELNRSQLLLGQVLMWGLEAETIQKQVQSWPSKTFYCLQHPSPSQTHDTTYQHSLGPRSIVLQLPPNQYKRSLIYWIRQDLRQAGISRHYTTITTYYYILLHITTNDFIHANTNTINTHPL